MWNPLFATLATLVLTSAAAQDSFLISEPEINTCQASLQDTGGEAGGGYQNNENFITVICPDSPGMAVSLNFNATPFNLSLSGVEPADRLSIWDGPNETHPLLGSWTGNDSPGIVSASYVNVQNTGGCLTVRFTSNSSGTGRFAAFISCAVPCEPPTASAIIVGASQLPVLACQNEAITFDGSASTAVEGFSIAEYKWDFGDGTVDSLSGTVVNHAFTTGGEHLVQLYLTDDNDCASTNSVDLRVLVSTTPLFNGASLADTTVCLGQPVTLDATGIAAANWSAMPNVDFGAGLYLPDDASEPFLSTLTLTGFAPDATLQDIADLASICVSMEHSYMGDLLISMICPNGQNVYLHAQGGGGTFLGLALDGETDPPTPGVCWNYCWDPDATNGTWAENEGEILPSGSYQSVQPMTQLIGCPLNGDWTFSVTDLFGADDGFVCSWGINFDPDLYPGAFTFTPVLGLSDPDSAHWSGANLTTDPADPLVAQVNTPEPGTFAYVFAVTDNFGCTYDTTVTVTVIAPDLSLQGIDGPSVIEGTDPVQYTALGAGADVTGFNWTLPPGWTWYDDLNLLDSNAFVLAPIASGAFQLCVVAEGLGCIGEPVCMPIDVITSTEQLAGNTGVRVFPNPSTGVIQLVRPTAHPTTLTVVDALGRTVHQHGLQGTHPSLDLGHLGAGTYVLQWWEGARPHRLPVTLAR